MSWKETYQSKLTTAEDIASRIKDGDSVSISPLSATPPAILEAIEENYLNYKDVLLTSCALMYDMEFMNDPDKYKGHLEYITHFVMPPWERMYAPEMKIKYSSVTFSHIEEYFENYCACNVMITGASTPDDEGYMWFGPQGCGQNGHVMHLVDRVYVQTTPDMPKVGGEDGTFNKIHVDDVDAIVEEDFWVIPVPYSEPSDIEKKIADHILDEIDDGSTVQIGIGGVANAVGYGLENKKDLGCYTEMIGESTMHLIKTGAINKPVMGGFLLGNEELYEFGADPANKISIRPVGHVCDSAHIGTIPNMISINTCLMTDLTGQVCSEAVGSRVVACTGGSNDFIRGALLSEGGKSFIAVPSTREVDGETISNIVATLPPYTPVTVPRTDVMYIVTEYGIADVYNKPVQDRIEALINVAHPDFRDELRKEAKEASLLP